ncbi:MAG: hypothetical protein GKR95_18940 [Gammaproteobacteria bacterium]|nr:hypothetical protein [Gammaproteobacteria bacterium]NKB64094.1 hypothetical protein [Gammaproteobacteria bacterium]
MIESHYLDFGPTLAMEKLSQIHDIHLPRETLRQWMIDAGIWVTRKKRSRIHQPRNRRQCLGEPV